MKILFLSLRNLHLPHLLPIYKWMERNLEPGFELFISSPEYAPSEAERAGHGLPGEEVQRLISEGVNWIAWERMLSPRPDVIVMADAPFEAVAKLGTKIVNVNHGLISKGYYYSDNPIVLRENDADLICVPGPFHRDSLKRLVHKPILVSGLVKFDRVFNGEIVRDEVLRRWGIDPKAKVVLFAPTFNLELSSVPVVTDSVSSWIGDGEFLLIKLHGMSPPEWVEMYRLIAELDSRIKIIDDIDITPALVAADVMVSDVSSAFMEFVALDKPVVLVNNPLRTRYIGFDPRDVEYQWRGVGIEVNRKEEVAGAVRRALDHPEELSQKRQACAERLAGPRDGRAAERIGQGIYDLAHKRVGGAERFTIHSAMKV